MTTAYFDPAVGGDGTSVSDNNYPTDPYGLGNGGHRYNFVRSLQQLVNIAAFVVARALEAATSAATALNAPGTQSTSSTSKTIGATGTQTWTTQTGKLWAKGQTIVLASSANPSNQFVGIVSAYNSGTGALDVIISSSTGTGTLSDWIISLTATGGVPITRTVSAGGLVTGGGALSGNLTLTVTAAVAADLWAATGSSTTAVTPAAIQGSKASIALTSATTVTINGANGDNFHVTAGHNILFANPTNFYNGKSGRIRHTQDGTGGRAPTFGSVWKFPGGAPSMSPGAGVTDVWGYFQHDASNVECGLLRNLS